MTKRGHITGFYLETLLLIAVFIAIILVLTHVFGLGQGQSAEAKLLTNAVCLAQNAAEGFFLEDPVDRGETETRYGADLTEDPEGEFLVRIEWKREDDMLRGEVTVQKGAETLYTLPVARYMGEVGA